MESGGAPLGNIGNISIKNLLTYIKSLSPDEKRDLFQLLDVQNEEDLKYIVRSFEDEPFGFQYPEFKAHKILLVYVPPFLLILGTFGNIFSFLIMRHKSMTRLSTYVFLAALSIADSMVLFIGLLRTWLGELTGFDLRDQADWLCKTIVILGYISSNTSVWIIVAVTVERFIVVAYPLKAQRLCTIPRAKKIIASLFFIFLAINIHLAWTVSLNKTKIKGNLVPRCDATSGHELLVRDVWPWVDALTYSFMPFIIISIFNVLIICKVARASSGRGNLQNGSLKIRSRCKEDTNLRITIMLLTVSFTFLLTTLPMNVSLIASAFWNKTGHDNAEMSKYRLIMTITQLLMYLNHSINFFLYCATGQKFRKEVIRMFCGKRSTTFITADHSKHLYCSRGCSHMHNDYLDVRRSIDETEM